MDILHRCVSPSGGKWRQVRERHGICMGKDTHKKQCEEETAGEKDFGEDLEALSLEEAFERIEETIGRLEEEETTLEESFLAYQKGMRLLQYCNTKIDKVEKLVLKIGEDGELDEF